MVRNRSTRAILVALAVVCVACTANVGLVPPEQMRPMELATYAMSIYNAQYDDYMAKATLPNLSEAEKRILRAKKDSLTAAWPIIKTYAWYVDNSHYPPAELQTHLLQWINSVRY